MFEIEDADDDDDVSQPAARRAHKERTVITKDELHAIVAEATRATLVQLGIDAEDPMEMQRDFQHLRQWRKAGEDLRSKGLLTLLAIVISGACGALWVGFKGAVGH